MEATDLSSQGSVDRMRGADIEVDALVIGGGIAGMQSALDLANQGYRVLLVEKEPSIGGKMVSLSKVFPTLDCASCITTPRMSETAHHPNITMFTYTEVERLLPTAPHGFEAVVVRKPRYVDERDCIGCRQCEYVCPVSFPDPFDQGLGVAKGIRVPFATAIPQVAVLDPDQCTQCGRCARACPTDAVRYDQLPEEVHVRCEAVLVATGFELTPFTAKKEYQGGIAKNVITSLQMERLLAPNGPFGRVLRPGDGKVPDSIAYVQCAGSRDLSLGIPYCSRVCCMYAIKQAMLLSGALPWADITIYYMDIRAFGKNYEQFYQNAKAMGIEFVKAKVAKITEQPSGDLSVRVELIDDGGAVTERTHDLVVLSLGLVPAWDPRGVLSLQVGDDKFVHCPHEKTAPSLTDQPGVFVAGTAAGPKDIVDTIVEAGGAAVQVVDYLTAVRKEAETAALVAA